MAKKNKQIIGSISHGTMREEDLIPRFLDTLKQLDRKTYYKLKRENKNVFKWLNDPELVELDYNQKNILPELFEELGYFLNEELFDALNNVAPPLFLLRLAPWRRRGLWILAFRGCARGFRRPQGQRIR